MHQQRKMQLLQHNQPLHPTAQRSWSLLPCKHQKAAATTAHKAPRGRTAASPLQMHQEYRVAVSLYVQQSEGNNGPW